MKSANKGNLLANNTLKRKVSFEQQEKKEKIFKTASSTVNENVIN